MFCIKKLKKEIKKAEVISFDIFDTLLLRPYVAPQDLFMHLEQIYRVRGFAAARVEAEQDVRKTFFNREEVNFDEIYGVIDEKYKFLKTKEMALEQQVLQPNPEMKEIFDFALSQKKRIIIISDMYFSKEFLEKILIDKGFAGFEKLYVSSFVQKTKARGSLYPFVCADMGLKASEILHIGDNKQADFKNAEKNGLRAFHYQKPLKQLFEKHQRAAALQTLRGGGIGNLTFAWNTFHLPHFTKSFLLA